MATPEVTKRDGSEQGPLLPPGDYVVPELDQTITPVLCDRGFSLIEAGPDDTERSYPLDPETGQPYLIRPVDTESRYPGGTFMTFHHFRYYKSDIHLGGGTKLTAQALHFKVLAGLGARIAFGEYIPRSLHDVIHHERFKRGPALSTTVADKYYNVVTGIAGIVPRQVLDMTKPEGQELVDVDDNEFEQIAAQDRVGIEYHRSPIKKARAVNALSMFLLRYAATQDVSHMQSQVETYINLRSKDTYRREEVGRQLIMAGVEVAIDPLRPILTEFRASGRVQPGKADALTEVLVIAAAGDIREALPNLDLNLKGRRMREARQHLDQQRLTG